MNMHNTDQCSPYSLQKKKILIIVIALISIFFIFLFTRDIPSRLANGNKGDIAIKILDHVRRPFLDIHEVESLLLAGDYNKTIHERFEHALKNAIHLIADFKIIAAYNPDLLERVEELTNTFEEWMNYERVLINQLTRNIPDNVHLFRDPKNFSILAITSKYFSLTMEHLGNAEVPIHKDIHEGSKAQFELIISGAALLFCFICIVFFLQWFRNKELNDTVELIKRNESEFESMAYILEESLNEIYIFDSKTLRFLKVNKGARINLGYSMEELSSLTPIDLKPEITSESFEEIIEPLRSGEKRKIEFTTVHRRKDGSTYDAEVHLQSSVFESAPVIVAIILDITERVHVEKCLQKSEIRYRDVAISMSDWIWEVDAQGKYTYASNSVKKVMGYDHEELLGQTPFDFMPPGETERVAKIFAEISTNRSPIVDLENWNISKDGHEICLLTNGVPVLDDEGRLLGYRGVDKDITERKKAEEQISKLSQALKVSASVFMITDNKGKIEYVNHRFTQLTGYTTENIIGQNPRFLKSDKTTTEVYKRLWDTITAGGTWKGELRNKKKNGELYWESLTISSMKNSEGVITNFVKVAEDITERKQAEEKVKKLHDTLEQRVLERTEKLVKANNEIQESEERFRQFTERIPEVFWITSQDFNRMIYVSPAYETIWGRTCKSVYNNPKDWLYNIHTEDREKVITAIDNHIKGVADFNEEYRIIRPDKSIRWIQDRAFSVRLPFKGFSQIIGIAQDITERKQAEHKLQVQNSYLNLLKVAAVAANEALEIKDAFYPILAQICNYTNWPLGHAYVISKDDPYLLEPTTVWYIEDNKKFIKFCNVTAVTNFDKGIGLPGRVLASGKPRWIIDVRKDKGFLRAEVAKELNIKSGIAFPVMVGTKVVAVLEFFTTEAVEPDRQFMDIMAEVGTQLGRSVERKQAEISILRSEERYSSIINDVLDTSNMGVFILDQDFRVVWLNKAMESYFGLKRDGIIGKEKRMLIKRNINQIFEDGGKFQELVLRTYDDNTYVENFICHVLPGKDREERWLEHWSQPIESGLYIGGRVEHYTDITNRMLAEEALLQSEKMKAMGIMTSGVAHEFNNILTVISNNAQLLKEVNSGDIELKESLSTICKMVDDGAEIVDRMYDFTGINTDTSQYISIDLNDLIKQVIGFTMPRWKEMAYARGITYQVVQENPKGLPSVLGNPSEIREVLLNIVNNALDAMPDGGRVSFHTRCSKDYVSVAISDTGNGMSEDTKKKIFDPFFTTRSPEGTGLGMSVSYGIIKRHDGEIDVESELGNGSTIILSLPVSRKSASTVVTHKQIRGIKVKNLNVLVVDDKDEICESLGKLFKEEGQNVWTVNNGADAIKLLKDENFDLVLCDLIMPGVNGRDILNMMKTLKKKPKVGIITGWKANLVNSEIEGIKADFVVKKPFNLSTLRRDINNIF